MQIDPEKYGAAIGQMVRDMIAPLIARLESVEQKSGQVAGISKEIAALRASLEEEVASIEISTDDVLAAIRSDPQFMPGVVSEYFTEHPPPKGEDGKDGKDAEPPEVTHDDIVRAIMSAPEVMQDAVSKHLHDHPVKDGIGLAGACINRDGDLVVTLSNGQHQNLGPVVGKDGDPGRDGADLSDVEFEYDGERTLTVRAKGGEIAGQYTMPIVIDRGYWRQGVTARKGDGYTHDGSWWIAIRDTDKAPSSQAKEDWRMGARKGRDGQKVVVEQKPQGPVKFKGAGDESDND